MAGFGKSPSFAASAFCASGVVSAVEPTGASSPDARRDPIDKHLESLRRKRKEGEKEEQKRGEKDPKQERGRRTKKYEMDNRTWVRIRMDANARSRGSWPHIRRSSGRNKPGSVERGQRLVV